MNEITSPAPVQSPAPVIGQKLNNFQLAALAQEVAKNIRPVKDILDDYRVSEEQYAGLLQNSFFKRTLNQLVIDWNSASKTNERIGVEAAAALEDAMPSIASRMSNNDEPLPAVVEAAKLFAKLAGAGEEKPKDNAGDKFSIVINLGDDKKLTFEKDVTPTPPVIEKKPNVKSKSRAV